MKREVPNEITDRLQSWKFYRSMWATIHYSFGLGAICLSILNMVKPLIISPAFLELIGWLSVLLVIAVVFLRSDLQANAFWTAWRILENQVGQFQSDENIGVKELFNARAEAEETLNRIRPYPF